MLAREGSPAGDSGGQNTPATPSASALNLRCGRRPQRGNPLPLLLRRQPRFRPPRPVHRRLASAPVRASILRPNTPPAAVWRLPAEHRDMPCKCGGGPFLLRSSRFLLHPPRRLLSGRLAQTRVLSRSSNPKTVIIRPKNPKNPKNPRFTQTRVLSPSTSLTTLIVFRHFRLAQTRVLVLSTGVPNPARTGRMRCRREGGSVGYGDSDIGTPRHVWVLAASSSRKTRSVGPAFENGIRWVPSAQTSASVERFVPNMETVLPWSPRQANCSPNPMPSRERGPPQATVFSSGS